LKEGGNPLTVYVEVLQVLSDGGARQKEKHFIRI